MLRLINRLSEKTGLPPGALVHIGDKKAEKVEITIIEYDEAQFQEREVETIEECFPLGDKPAVKWIDVDGLHEVEILERLGDCFGFHPLVLEDILNTGQRPKMEDLGEYVFVVLRMLSSDANSGVDSEQVSILLGPDFVVSLQEREGDVFDPIRERIRTGRGRVRRKGADYLAYTLLDAVVDRYFIVLEQLGDRIELLEDELVTRPTTETLQAIHDLKSEMIFLRKSVWPLREAISGLERGESSLIQESTGIYLRDLYDHTIQVIDTVETLRDMVSGMLDIYLSSVSNRMNEVMKVLTIIATIFIPLTLVVGIYGMNFQYMPELAWRWGYPMVWAVMAVIGALMLAYFRRQRWL
jgi:magnesium transporter